MSQSVITLLQDLTLETQDDALKQLASETLEKAEYNIDACRDTFDAVANFGNESYTNTFKEALVISFCAGSDILYRKNEAQRTKLLDLIGGELFKADVKYRNTELLDDYYECLIEVGQTECAERFEFFGVTKH